MKKHVSILLLVLCCLGFALSAYASLPEGTDWYQGPVKQAFEDAKKENKPLFLYWGAVWCPPCNQIKKTVFIQDAFKDVMKSYIPVYLDGDTPSAQIWSDKLGVTGYPTMVVYAPSGEEMVRIPSGTPLNAYVGLLETAAEKMIPMEELLEKAINKPDGLSEGEWNLMAGYSWFQSGIKFEGEEEFQTFETLHNNVPLEFSGARSKLFFQYLEVLMGAEKELDAKLREELTILLGNVLRSPELVRSNLSTLYYSATDIISYLYVTEDEHCGKMIERWLQTMKDVEQDDTLSIAERLDTVYPAINLFKMDNEDAELPEDLKAQVKEMCLWADTQAKGHYERQAVMGSAIYYLSQSKQYDAAKELALAELEKSETPYYFMFDLADIAEKQGNKKEARGWYNKAWQTAEGHATRIQWGTIYLTGLLGGEDDDAETFKTDFLTLFQEALQGENVFAGRNLSRGLNRISGKVADWNAEKTHNEYVTALRTELMTACDSYINKDTCVNWVESFGVKN